MTKRNPETTRRKQGGGQWKPGQSGNPEGRPAGARNRLTVLAEQIMADDAEAVVRKVIEAAKAGDMTAAKLILDRVAPLRKGRPVVLDLPTVEKVEDVLQALGVVIAETAAGNVTPEEAAILAGVLDAKRKAIETADIERRLAALEEGKR
jgi:hypothetical protein